MNKKLFFEDFNIGDKIKTGKIHVTMEMIKDFASQYDPQPMHLDEDAAKDTIFGELVGSGWHTAALTMKLMAEADPLGNPLIGLEVNDFKFAAPLKPGDTLGVKAEITKSWRSKSKPLGFFNVLAQTYNQDERLILSQVWTIILPTRD